MKETLSRKTAIVTGASSGIGRAIARRLVKEDANVVLAARNVDKLESIRTEIGEKDKTLAVQTDMTKQKDVNHLAKCAKEVFGHVDIYVNSAGKMDSSRVLQGDVSDWDQMIDLNIKGVLYGIHSVLPDMVERKSGHIVNIDSDAGHEVTPRLTVYSGTKYAVRAISEGMEKELQKTGVRVTNISPGSVDTPLTADSPFDSERQKLKPADIAEAVIYAVTQPKNVNVNEITVRPD